MVNQPNILYEDEYLLAIDKPSGVVVNSGFGAENTLQDWIDKTQDFPLAHSFEMRNGIVHRLDKETSGVLLIAKTSEAFYELQRQFKDRGTEKVYVGLVHGVVEPKERVIDAPIGRNLKNRMKFGVVEGGRDARTSYTVTQLLSNTVTGEKYTLVEFRPHTGRTHQIRVHAKHIGHPIVADYQYAGRKTTRRDRKWCPRLFLHAAKLTFRHPAGATLLSQGDKRQTVEAPLPEDLQSVLQSLE